VKRLFSMRSRSLAFVAVGAVVLLAAAWDYYQGTLARAASGLTDMLHPPPAAEEPAPGREALDQRLARIRFWNMATEQICHDLIAGRLTLIQAARRVKELPNTPPLFWVVLEEQEKGQTDDERLCWHLIDRACLALGGDSGEAAALRQRLEAELQAKLDRQ